MKKRLLSAVLATGLTAATLAGCQTSVTPATPATPDPEPATSGDVDPEPAPAADGETKKVGVAMPTKDLQRWNQDGENMEKKLKEAGYEVDIQYASNDVNTQVTQIETMIAGGCDVLVIASIEGDSLGTVLAQAKEKNIPVIAYDRLIMNSDAVTYYATFDNKLVGTKQGQYIEEKLGLKEGKKGYNMEIFTGDPGDNNARFFYGGAMEVLKPYIDNGQITVPSGQIEFKDVATAEWKSENAQTRMEAILSKNYAKGEKLDAVLCSNDSTAFGVATALANGYTGDYPIITGQDCDKPNVKLMLEDKQAMSIFKDTRTLADKTVEMVDAILKGGEAPVNDTTTYDNGDHVVPSYLCEPVFADKSNYKELLIDSNYYTEDDLK
jgi:putative multiple sugar transport system substrate-binding protein